MKQKLFSLIILLITIVASSNAQENSRIETAEDVVDRQLEAYNARDIDKFVETFSEDVEIYNLKGTLTMKGHDQLRKAYDALFKNTPNLHCRIVNRIKINNKVIDLENVDMNERLVEAVAIYEVTDGKITKVTFVD